MVRKKKKIYLDYAAGLSANPSSPHDEGRRAKKILEDARTLIARLTEVQADDVIFTGGATEANAIAILGITKVGDHALYLPSAHASVVENMKLLNERGVDIEALPIKDWKIDCEKLKGLLRPNTKLIAMDAVCGETGVIWNTREVAQVLKTFAGTIKKSSVQVARPIQLSFLSTPVLHVDASQAPLTEKITRAHFGADTLTLDASKVSSVRGIGALIAHRTIPIVPLYIGGGQERGIRPGSEAPNLANDFAKSLQRIASGREIFRSSAQKNRAKLLNAITSTISHMYVNESKSQAPHILNISLPSRDTDYLVALLNDDGFAVSTRSACETDSKDGSRAVYALTNDKELARSTLRISWGPEVSTREFGRFAKSLARSISFIDNGQKR